jgi:outer membrane autotransporter protein
LINQEFTSDVFYLGLYLNSEDVGGWDIRSTLGYAYGDTDSERDVNFGPYFTRAKGSFNSHSFFAGVRGSTPWYSNETVTLSPELGLLYAHYRQDSFTESGDRDLVLALDSATAQSLVTSVGVKADFASLSATHSVKPMLFARYEYDWLATDGDDHEVDAGLAAHPNFKTPFVGQNRGPHALVAGVGLSSDVDSALQVNGGLLYSYASHGSEWGAALNLQYAF